MPDILLIEEVATWRRDVEHARRQLDQFVDQAITTLAEASALRSDDQLQIERAKSNLLAVICRLPYLPPCTTSDLQHTEEARSRPPFSAETLAERWGCSKRQIQRMAKDGRLPHFWVGDLLRVKASVVAQIEAGECQNEENQDDTGSAGTEAPGGLSPEAITGRAACLSIPETKARPWSRKTR